MPRDIETAESLDYCIGESCWHGVSASASASVFEALYPSIHILGRIRWNL